MHIPYNTKIPMKGLSKSSFEIGMEVIRIYEDGAILKGTISSLDREGGTCLALQRKGGGEWLCEYGYADGTVEIIGINDWDA